MKKYTRKEASEYIKNKHGITYAATTLAKFACIGGGPKFMSVGKFPYYPEDELDKWVESITSPIKSKSSD